MQLEIGGGRFPRGNSWINIDLEPEADIVHDLNKRPWPIVDDAVEAVCSSHCLEHLDDPHETVHEIARVCKVGAAIEIRVPHPSAHLAMTAGHKHVFSPIQAINMEKHFPDLYWKGKKRLRLDKIEYGSTELLAEARRELPFLNGLSDEVVMKWIPGTCHDCRFFYTCVLNEIKARERPWRAWE